MTVIRDTASPLLKQLLADITGSFVLTLVIDSDSSDKLQFLARGHRDFLAITPSLETAMAERLQRTATPFLAAGRSFALAYPAVGRAYLEQLQARIAAGGGDVASTFAPLRETTVRRKGHRRIGFDAGDLASAIENATVTVRRV